MTTKDLDTLKLGLHQMIEKRRQAHELNPILPDPTTDLDIVFYGLACFDPFSSGRGYRVLFPNGLDADFESNLRHVAGIWIRDRDKVPLKPSWEWFDFDNDFFLGDQRALMISGLVSKPLQTYDFEGHLTVLEDG